MGVASVAARPANVSLLALPVNLSSEKMDPALHQLGRVGRKDDGVLFCFISGRKGRGARLRGVSKFTGKEVLIRSKWKRVNIEASRRNSDLG